MIQSKDPLAITILGSGGGVAKSVLSILNQACSDPQDPIYSVMSRSTLHLIDIQQKSVEYFHRLFPLLEDKMILYTLDLKDILSFEEHLRQTTTKLVIDVSWADTIEMLNCCNQLGVSYINSALENTQVDDDPGLYGFPLTERYIRFEAAKDTFINTTALIGSGMNPGVVQWMALQLMQEEPLKKPAACYIVEHDTSFFTDHSLIKSDTLYTSWSVECFLDEAIHSYPMFVKHQIPFYLYEDVYALEYKVTLGPKEFYGCLMPHEEVLSLGKFFDMEMGFIYRVNEHTTQLIRENLANADELWDWNHQVIDPTVGEVAGEDLVGVLLVYEDHENYLLNSMKSTDIFPKYHTNATYFQVACGIYAGLASLILDPLPSGVHYVDELLLTTPSKYGNYLTCHMKDFIKGRNEATDGFLHERIRRV